MDYSRTRFSEKIGEKSREKGRKVKGKRKEP